MTASLMKLIIYLKVVIDSTNSLNLRNVYLQTGTSCCLESGLLFLFITLWLESTKIALDGNKRILTTTRFEISIE